MLRDSYILEPEQENRTAPVIQRSEKQRKNFSFRIRESREKNLSSRTRENTGKIRSFIFREPAYKKDSSV